MSPLEKGRGKSAGLAPVRGWYVAQAYTGPPSTASQPPPADLPNVAPAAPRAQPPPPPPHTQTVLQLQ